MARKKISEFKAKQLLYPLLNLPFSAVHLDSTLESEQIIRSLPEDKKYVIKVDQGVKGRMKKGLVNINCTKEDLLLTWKEIVGKGYSNFYLDEYIDHQPDDEHFLSLERTREGIMIYYSEKGGIHIENHTDEIKKQIYSNDTLEEIAQTLHVSSQFIQQLIKTVETYHISFLEINPLVVTNNIVHILDLAIEVDSAGEFFVENKWTKDDFVESSKKSIYEQQVESLARKSQSQASFNLSVLNPNGSIFLLLSGGGASLVLADELYNLGYGEKIANYGEYSGNPTTIETYHYTKILLELLLQSNSQNKVLIIGGGVANFTDIRKTFTGIVKALEEKKELLQQQSLQIFVRRGGPFEREGLGALKTFLEKEGFKGMVTGSEMVLTDIISHAVTIL